MTARAVHWHEGMFLRPHHLQAAQRHAADQGHTDEKWDHHYNWGLREIKLDLDALANNRLVVRLLRARLRDGTLVSIPEDGELPAVDLQPAFERAAAARESTVTAFLAVPTLHLGRPNVADGTPEGGRYLVDEQELEDENTGLHPQPVQVRRLNLQVLFSSQGHAGYEVLPLARIEKSARAGAPPQLAESYVPPTLACDGWAPLNENILSQIYDRIGKKVELLSKQVVSRDLPIFSPVAADAKVVGQLRAINEAYALLSILLFAKGVHPLTAYLELARLVGQLSIFGPERRPPALKPYDHDNIGRCFYDLKHHIDALLDKIEEPDYEEVPFIGAGLRMEVHLKPAWLEPIYQMYVGVQSSLSPEECVKMLTRADRMDMKIGSSNRVDVIYKNAMMGLKFDHILKPPSVLPGTAGLIYFQVKREAQLEEWQQVQGELTLAIRLNERNVAGDIEKQRVLTVYNGMKGTTTLQFTLYVVRQVR